VNSPIPQEGLQRQAAPRVVDAPTEPTYVPGEATVLESVTIDGDTVEMAAGAPQMVVPGGRQPSFPVTSPEAWPIHLTGQVLIRPNAGGSPNLQALRAPAKTWLKITEIKFSVQARPGDNADVTFSTYTALGFGAVVAASFVLDGKALTAGPVPLSVFGPSRKLTAERLIFSEPGQAQQARAEEYVWPLSVPIFVPPGSVLVPTFEHRGFLDYNIRVRVSYAGELLAKEPTNSEKTKLPFASAWVSPTLALDGTRHEAESTEKDLVGPAGQQFNVEYFIGRQYLTIQSTTFKAILDADMDANTFVALGTIERNIDSVGLKIGSSWGSPLVTEFSPVYAVFDRVSRQLPAEHIMPEGGYYIAEVTNNEATVANENVAALTVIGLIGWQEVVS
jgi:hypothetical protein